MFFLYWKYSGNRKTTKLIYYHLCRTISEANKLPDLAQPVLYQPKWLLPSPIAHTSGHPAPRLGVEEKQAQRSGNESFSQIGVRVHSSLPVRPASHERWSVCWTRRVKAGVITHGLSPFGKHTKEGCVCLIARKREKGRWQLNRGWLLVECRLYLALSPPSYLKKMYLGSVWEWEQKNVACRQLTKCSLLWCCSVIVERLCVCVFVFVISP